MAPAALPIQLSHDTIHTLSARVEAVQEGFRRGTEASGIRIGTPAVTSRGMKEGEMKEIAATFQEAGLPGEFHLAAAEVYQRMAKFKDSENIPPLIDVLSSLRKS